MMLTCWFVSNLLPPSVWAITRCPGSSSHIHIHDGTVKEETLYPSTAISHIRFQFSTVSYTSKRSSREKNEENSGFDPTYGSRTVLVHLLIT
jgi:hypothetical protein